MGRQTSGPVCRPLFLGDGAHWGDGPDAAGLRVPGLERHGWNWRHAVHRTFEGAR